MNVKIYINLQYSEIEKKYMLCYQVKHREIFTNQQVEKLPYNNEYMYSIHYSYRSIVIIYGQIILNCCMKTSVLNDNTTTTSS